MAHTTRSPAPDRTRFGAVVRATVDPLPSCGCGQALDRGRPRYCPRCGVTLRRGPMTGWAAVAP